MTTVRQTITAAAVGAITLLTGVRLCTLPGPTNPTEYDGCRILHPSASFLTSADYTAAGEWIAENGDGPVIGYALTEDSPIYNTHNCAEWSN